MKKIIPEKLKKGDKMKVVAPSCSAGIISDENIDLACKRIEKEFGFTVLFGENIKEKDIFNSVSIDSCLSDINDAFEDGEVKVVSTAVGGFNSNRLLNGLDWELISRNPKVFCGYSDITVLSNAMFAKTGLVNYSGPFFSTFAQKQYMEYTIDYFKKCLFSEDEYEVTPSEQWLDDHWYKDQDKREPVENKGYRVIKPGFAEGVILGGNLCSFALLFGTEYMPDLEGAVVFLENDNYTLGVDILEFDRQLQALLHQKGGDKIKGVVVGRFQRGSGVKEEDLRFVFETKKELKDVPVISDVDFGHTNPMITFPIGGVCELQLKNDNDFTLKVRDH